MDVPSGCSHTPVLRYDHIGDSFPLPPRLVGGATDKGLPAFREDMPSRPSYVPRLSDSLSSLPPAITSTRPVRPSSYHDPYSAGHRAVSRSNTGEPPLSLVPMNNLIAHHPFPRDVQDEEVLRVFMPRLE